MVTIINNGMPRKGATQGAYGTKLLCPNLVTGLSGNPEMCNANRWEFVEKIGPFRVRYRCKACHKTVIYEYANNPGHPYEAYGKNKWQKIVENWKRNKKN